MGQAESSWKARVARETCPQVSSAQISVSQGVQVVVELLTGLQKQETGLGHTAWSCLLQCVCDSC